jgi:protein-tyrosine phosphatase
MKANASHDDRVKILCAFGGAVFTTNPHAFRRAQQMMKTKFDELVKSQKCPRIVIPVKTGKRSLRSELPLHSKLSSDWHCHLLPGLDDGPATIEESVEMAAALQNVGFNTVYCTPHLIKGTYETDNATVLTTLANLQTRLQKENIAIKLFPGREHFMDEFLADYLKDPLPLGETRFILIEIPSNIPAEFVKETCFNVKRSGYVPMIAHPERCVLFAPAPSSCSRLKTLFHQPPAPSPQPSVIRTPDLPERHRLRLPGKSRQFFGPLRRICA